jgi:hypothetical protein
MEQTGKDAVTPSPPFPRDIETDPCAPALRARLEADAAPLWANGTIPAARLHAGPSLVAALERLAREGALVPGLEAAQAALESEEAGLAALEARDRKGRTARISRVLLLANDGAERFYRAAESLTRTHATRLLTCRLDVPAETLGRHVLGRPASVKAVLVQRKGAVSAVLRAIAGAA